MRWEYFPNEERLEKAIMRTDTGEQVLSVLESTTGHYSEPSHRFSFVKSHFVDFSEEKSLLRKNAEGIKLAMLKIACQEIEADFKKQIAEIENVIQSV